MNGANGMMPPSNYGAYPDHHGGYAPPQPQHLATPQPQPDFFPGSVKPQIYTVCPLSTPN